ncbi:hypothetical protein [Ruminococcus sp. XPD3002]|uniref:hypothetical protein n=1 Tax=Ruminococcus sp. XPD3002 TaxID=1452269 RepID=UPI000921C551|nr:hypothetical protein SAMN04487832_110137 [Ruminococcus flavefaciens]
MENVMTNGFVELSAMDMCDVNGGSLGECLCVAAGAGIGGKVGGYIGGTIGSAAGPAGTAVGILVGTAAGYGIYHLCDWLF